jgi:hypothetical protein
MNPAKNLTTAQAMRMFGVVALLASLPAIALAQTIYQVRMPDGSVLFTDKPPREGTIVDQREAKPPPPIGTPRPASVPQAAPVPPSETARPPGAPAAAQNGRPLSDTGPGARRVAGDDIADAQRALDEAKARLEAGREPQSGETQGIQRGGTRLTDDYFARIQRLERDVADAEQRLQRAIQAGRR